MISSLFVKKLSEYILSKDNFTNKIVCMWGVRGKMVWVIPFSFFKEGHTKQNSLWCYGIVSCQLWYGVVSCAGLNRVVYMYV